jgi:DNA-binding MarR family transcriptional regulator
VNVNLPASPAPAGSGRPGSTPGPGPGTVPAEQEPAAGNFEAANFEAANFEAANLEAATVEAATVEVAKVDAVRALARASRLLERASGEVNLAHYRVLAAIASGDQRASRIAAKLALGKPTISASVESLCKRGLLMRSGVEGDQRAAALQLTDEGYRVLANLEAAMVAWVDEVCARTPDPGLVLRVLGWMGEGIEQLATEREAEGRAL